MDQVYRLTAEHQELNDNFLADRLARVRERLEAMGATRRQTGNVTY